MCGATFACPENLFLDQYPYLHIDKGQGQETKERKEKGYNKSPQGMNLFLGGFILVILEQPL